MSDDEMYFPDDAERFRTIGEIVTEFSHVEGLVCELFGRYAGLPREISRCITGQLQLRQMLNMLAPIAKAAKIEEEPMSDLDAITEALAGLMQERNKIIHWEWHIIGPTGTASIARELTGKTAGVSIEIPYSNEDLSNVLFAITVIGKRINGHLVDPARWATANGIIRSCALAPWLDRPLWRQQTQAARHIAPLPLPTPPQPSQA